MQSAGPLSDHHLHGPVNQRRRLHIDPFVHDQ